MVIFLAAIFLPCAASVFNFSQTVSTIEKRELAPFPRVKWNAKALADFPPAFDAFFNDHFGFRNHLISLNNYIQAKYFRVSPVKKVIIGDNGWFYVTVDSLIEDFQGKYRLTPLQLESWKNDLENKEKWLARRGIKYLFVVAPNKQTIYPEHMPLRYRITKGKTQMDQLAEYLDLHSTVQILDLRDPLLHAKQENLVYYKTDAHWNDIGVYIAYTSIMDKLSGWFPDIAPLGPEDFENKLFYDNKGGEIAEILQLVNELPEGESHLFRLKSPHASNRQYLVKKEGVDEFKKKMLPFYRNCRQANRRVLVLRDSFFTDLDPLIAEHFRQSLYIWTFRPLLGDEWQFRTWTSGNLSIEALIDYFKPDVVIEEKAERLIFSGVSPEKYHFFRGNNRLLSRNFDEAVKNYKASLQLNPDNEDAVHALNEILNSLYKTAGVYDQRREYAKSILCYEKILSLFPDEHRAAYEISGTYARQGDIENAISWLKKTIKMGYHNFDQIKADKRFANFRGVDAYKKHIQRLVLIDRSFRIKIANLLAIK